MEREVTGCYNCKYHSLCLFEEPCSSCNIMKNMWEPKEDTKMEKRCSNCKYFDLPSISEPCVGCRDDKLLWEPKDGKKEDIKMEKEFTKDMLEDSMVVETRDGNRLLVCGDKLMDMDGMIKLSHYDNDMLHTSFFSWGLDRGFDIIKVYDKVNTLKQISTFCLKLLWERKEIKEVTLKEIAEKFGVEEVKVIND